MNLLQTEIQKKMLLLAAAWGAAALINLQLLSRLLQFSLKNEFASHILLIPFISAALVFRNRAEIFSRTQFSALPGAGVSFVAIAVLVFSGIAGFGEDGTNLMSLKTAALVTLLIGIFLFMLGAKSFYKALFPLLFLLFMVPIPEAVLKPVVLSLQNGAAETSAILFKLTGTPFLRDGFSFALPGVNIEIATQCSGIRSSLALCITCLLAGYLMLESGWKRLVFVLAAIPMAMFKNGVRIVTLSLLAIHVDMSWLTSSNLHHDGGILFFLGALVMLWPLLWLLRRSEVSRPRPPDVAADAAQTAEIRPTIMR